MNFTLKLSHLLGIAISLAAIALFAGCSKDDDNAKNENNSSNPTLRTATYIGKTVSGKTFTLTITENPENALRSSSASTLRSTSQYTPQPGDTYELTDDTLTSAGTVKSYKSYVMILISGKCWYQEFQITVENEQISTIAGEVDFMTEEACLAKRYDNEEFIIDLGGNPGGWDDNDDGGGGDDNGGKDEKGNTDGGGDGGSGGDNEIGDCTDGGIITVNNLPCDPSFVSFIAVYDYAGELIFPFYNLEDLIIGNNVLKDYNTRDHSFVWESLESLAPFSKNGRYTVSIRISDCDLVDYLGNTSESDIGYGRLFQVDFSCGNATINWDAPVYDVLEGSNFTINYP
jgi:hypothetical protein